VPLLPPSNALQWYHHLKMYHLAPWILAILWSNLLLGCDLDHDLFSNPHCNWIHQSYMLPKADRDSFGKFMSDHFHDACICTLLLKPFECISPDVMTQIYIMYCNMSNDDQMSLLSFCYSTKCWRENKVLLRAKNFLCYSLSYEAAMTKNPMHVRPFTCAVLELTLVYNLVVPDAWNFQV
jgi:hypothetical protein